MEVRSIGQGGQTSLDAAKNVDRTIQVNDKHTSDNPKPIENKDIDNENVDKKDVEKAVDKLNKFLEDNKTHAEYEIHDKFKDIMIKIVDDKSGQVIQELPPKKVLDMVAKMCEIVGVLFDKKA